MGDTCLARSFHARDLGEALQEYCLVQRYRTRRRTRWKTLQLHKFGAFTVSGILDHEFTDASTPTHTPTGLHSFTRETVRKHNYIMNIVRVRVRMVVGVHCTPKSPRAWQLTKM
jgi:hypothetical protein